MERFALAVFLLLAATAAADACAKIIDVDVILQLPLTQRDVAIKQTKTFFKSLVRNEGRKRCWRPRFTVVDFRIYEINTFECSNDVCISNGIKVLDKIPVVKEGQYSLSPKDNILRALKNLEREVENDIELPQKRIAVLILSLGPKKGKPISDAIKILLENRFTFIAAGIGDGRKHNLNSIASNRKSLFLRDFSVLNAVETFKQFAFFLSMEAMPSMGKSVFGMVKSKDAGNLYDKVLSETSEETCQYMTDICFLIDSSASINVNTDFVQMKKFVMRIANRFGISEDGTHGSAVVFSDRVPYTKVTIRFKDFFTTKGFQQAITKTPYMQYRTRIDLAFKFAEEDIFLIKNGARPNIKKNIFLLTDGRQNPPNYDPVVASENLHARGVNIYAIGIGNGIDKNQLNRITRDPNKVFYAGTFSDLDSPNFVKKVSNEACLPAIIPTPVVNSIAWDEYTTPCTDAPGKGCAGVGNCKDCCGSRDVYINIFQPNSGPHYIMQGLELKQSSNGGVLHGVTLPPKGPSVKIDGNTKLDVEKLIEVVKKSLSGQPAISGTIVDLLKTSVKKNQLPVTSIASGREEEEEEEEEVEKRRRRRSISDEYEDEQLKVLRKIAKVAGCNLFFAALKKHNLIRNVTAMMKAKKKVALFCPIDSAFGEIYKTNSVVEDELSILMNLIGVKHDRYGTMYNTLLPGGKVGFNPVGKDATQLSWKANDVDVIFTITAGTNIEVVVLKNVIFPNTHAILDVLKTSKNVNIFRRLLLSSGMKNVFSARDIASVCFSKTKCVLLSGPMKEHLKDVIDFNQYTIIAPVDAVFDQMPALKLKSLMDDPIISREFLQEHVFLGSFSDHSNHFKEIAHSISPTHSLMTMNVKDGKIFFADNANKLFEVKKSERVAEGMLYIIDRSQ